MHYSFLSLCHIDGLNGLLRDVFLVGDCARNGVFPKIDKIFNTEVPDGPSDANDRPG
jgi:hypothetical protein